MNGKHTFSRQYFWVFEKNTSHLTLEMKSKYTKEHSTAYKVGGLELIAEELFRVHIQFFAKTELETIR